MSCSIDGCDKKIRAVKLRLCGSHYMRLLRHGSATGGKNYADKGDNLKFLKSLIGHVGDECVKWPFRTNADGGAEMARGCTAYRLMCKMAHGEPPTLRHHATHSCGKGHESCINPNHLEWGTVFKNQQDRVEHGTSNRGERHGLHKLKSETVLEIFHRLSDGETPYLLSSQYKISPHRNLRHRFRTNLVLVNWFEESE